MTPGAEPINGRVKTDLIRLFVANPAKGQVHVVVVLATAAVLHEAAPPFWVAAWVAAQVVMSGLVFRFKRRVLRRGVTADNAAAVDRKSVV